VNAYTVHPGHHVTPPTELEWAPPAPSEPDIPQQANSPNLDTLNRVLSGLRRLDTNPAHRLAPRLYGAAHP
jgi:hypothetical protein